MNRLQNIAIAAILILAISGASHRAIAQSGTRELPRFDFSELRPDLALVLPALCQLAGGDLVVPDGVLVDREARDLAAQWNAPEDFLCAGVSLIFDREIDTANEQYREVGVQLLYSSPDGRVAIATVVADIIVGSDFVLVRRAVAKASDPQGNMFRIYVVPAGRDTSPSALARLSYSELVRLLIDNAIEPGSGAVPPADAKAHPATILAIDLGRRSATSPKFELAAGAPHQSDETRSWSLDGWHIAAISGAFVFGDASNPVVVKNQASGAAELLSIVP